MTQQHDDLSGQNIKTTCETDKDLIARMEHAKWFVGGMLAVTFASLLTLVSIGISDYLQHIAGGLLAVSTPMIGIWLLCENDPQKESYRRHSWMPVVCVFGIFFSLIGMGVLFWSVSPYIGMAWLFSFVVVFGVFAKTK